MGHRRGIGKALERLAVPYLIWNEKEVVNPGKAQKIIVKPYPKERQRLLLEVSTQITHVIAGTEGSVVAASKARIWLEAKRNPHSLILRCTDKYLMKKYLFEKDIPMTKFARAKKGVGYSEYFEKLGSPFIAKPRKSSGSRGVSKVNTEAEFKKIVSQNMILEKAIEGQEGSVETLIDNGKIIFTNITTYKVVGHCNLIPGELSDSDKEIISALNEKVIKALKVSWGLTHMEFYRTNAGVLFGEIALRPPGGYIMEAISKAYNCNFWEKFVHVELGLPLSDSIELSKYASTIVLHPSAGNVSNIKGLDVAKGLASLVKLKLKVEVGDNISARSGTGEDVGHAILAHTDKKQLEEDVEAFLANFEIVLS